MKETARVTLKDIAKTVGVSVGTVHRAIYNKPGVSKGMRDVILQEVATSHFKLDEVASVLRRGELNIAVVLPSRSGENRFFYESVWQGILERAKDLEKFKVNFICVETEFDLQKQAAALSKLYDEQADEIHGLITIAFDETGATEWINRFANRGIPVVLVGSDAKNGKHICSVRISYPQAGKLAAEVMCRFVGEQEGTLVVLAGGVVMHSHRAYSQGFCEYISEHRPGYHLHIIYGVDSAVLKKEMKQAIEGNKKIIGVFSCNARNTFTMCNVLQGTEHNPQLVAVGTDVFEELIPAFENDVLAATVYQSPKIQAAKAVDALYEYLTSGVISHKNQEVPIGLVLQSNYRFYL